MPATTSPFFGINYGWALGENGWGDPMNSNLQVMSFLDKGAVDDFVATLPGSPATGDSVVLTTDNKLYAWFGNWVFITPQNGMEVIKLSDGTKWRFNGTIWIDVTAAKKSDLAAQVTSKRFLGSATDDAGTPDAIFKVDRTHQNDNSPHSFRDQTRFEPLSTAYHAACSYDGAMYTAGSQAIDHIISFQSRLNHYSTGLLTTLYGVGTFNVAFESLTNNFSFYANDTLNKAVTGQYGFYSKPVINANAVNAYGFTHNPGVFAPAVVTNCAGVNINSVGGDGTVTNEFGVLIQNLTKGAVKWPIYVTAQAGTSYFGSPTRIDNTLSIGNTVVQLAIGGLTSADFPAITYNYDPRADKAIFASQVSGFQWSATEFRFRYALAASAGATPSFSNLLTIRSAADSEFGAIAPGADNTQNLGRTAFRWKQIYAATTTISTSDAREKTEVRHLEVDEVAAAKALAKEFGAYRWLAAIKEKGDAARNHVGMTVQRAIEVMQQHGLDPMAYGFICYDKWDEQVIEHEALTEEHAPVTVEHDAVYEYGDDHVQVSLVSEAWTEVVSEAWTEVKREAWSETIPAGDRYSFRFDELLAFVAIGFEARLSAIESALNL